MSFTSEFLKRLMAPFTTLREKPGSKGKTFTYVTTTDVVKRLNEMFGLEWSFEVVDTEVVYDTVEVQRTRKEITNSDESYKAKADDKEVDVTSEKHIAEKETSERYTVEFEKRPITVIALVRLRIHDPEDKTIVYIKEHYGSAEVKWRQDGSAMVDLGNDKKAAVSDGLKKCATLMGVALDLTMTSTEDQRKEIKSLLTKLGGKIPSDERLQEMGYGEAEKLIEELKKRV